jgi:hypothetical protein
MNDAEPITEREPVTLESLGAKLDQAVSLLVSLSGAVVELNRTVTRHLESHHEDAKRDLVGLRSLNGLGGE